MKATRAKVILGTLLSAAVTVGVAPAAFARSVGAWAGNPIGLTTATRGTCFSESAGAVTGNFGVSACGNYVWEVNLPVDASGTYTVYITGSSVSPNPAYVQCTAYAVALDGTHTNANPVNMTSSVLTNTPLGSVTVPSGGNLFVACFNLQYGKIGTVNWNQ